MTINVIDLFAGCGGLTDGFLKTNSYRTLAAVDWETRPIKTLRNRLIKTYNYQLEDTYNRIFSFDIQRSEELLNGFTDNQYGASRGLIDIVGNQKVDLIIGGPPCQAYSVAGRVQDKNGMRNDYRNYLFESYIKIVQHFRPTCFVFENVPGILSAKPDGELITDKIRRAFSKAGYSSPSELGEVALFDLSDYGIPQKRKRVIIFGVRNDCKDILLQNFYAKLRSYKQEQVSTTGLALSGLPKLFPVTNGPVGKTSHKCKANHEFKNHVPRFHNSRDIKIFELLTTDIKSEVRKYDSIPALKKLYEQQTGKKSNFHKYNVLELDKPSNTIPAHLYKDGLRHIHPDPKQSRSITVREAARLQTFDDDFEFLGPLGEQFKMVGNAVPPKFSKMIAESVLHLFESQQ